MGFRRFSIISGFLLMAACFSVGQTPSRAETGIEGVITISPTQPGPVRADSPSSKPLVNATFGVETEKGEVASFTTDSQGHFRTSVPPGHYKVSMKGRKSSIGRFGPFEVEVAAGKITKVEWQCDSGIR
jgi:Prealbumin-like fold domain